MGRRTWPHPLSPLVLVSRRCDWLQVPGSCLDVCRPPLSATHSVGTIRGDAVTALAVLARNCGYCARCVRAVSPSFSGRSIYKLRVARSEVSPTFRRLLG